jgi:hypothetical protein
MRRWGVPECLHVPIVAVDEAAITDHIGDIVKVLSPGKALLVAIEPPPPRDARLPIWNHSNVATLFDPMQVWVSPTYTRYRSAYLQAKGSAGIVDRVLHHVYNRRMAVLRGYGYIRLVAVTRRANSSSAFTEQWGVELSSGDGATRRKAQGLRMQYADLSDILAMLDVSLGGGVQEAFRLGQNLIDVPGLRPPQR